MKRCPYRKDRYNQQIIDSFGNPALLTTTTFSPCHETECPYFNVVKCDCYKIEKEIKKNEILRS